MDYQNIDCQKCGCSNKLGTIFCRNCGTKLKFNKLMVSPKGQRRMKTFTRALKAVIVIAVLAFLGAVFCPYGFPEVPKITNEDEKSAIIATCTEIDRMLARENGGKLTFEFTAAEATFAANYLAVEHKKPDTKKKVISFSNPAGNFGGVTKMSSGSGLGKKPGLNFPSSSATEKKVKQEARKVTKKVEEEVEDVSFFDFTIAIKNSKTLSVVIEDKWMKYIPVRMELNVIPKLVADAETGAEILEYELSSARFGLLPLPLSMKEHILKLFTKMLLQERKWAEQYFKSIRSIEINADMIKVTFFK
ncbi:MAG: zinc ribbon domain-containing protein [Victivallales bacterium]|nr:zinc ribbon domain-containing protein [Victivallales bacterium]